MFRLDPSESHADRHDQDGIDILFAYGLLQWASQVMVAETTSQDQPLPNVDQTNLFGQKYGLFLDLEGTAPK